MNDKKRVIRKRLQMISLFVLIVLLLMIPLRLELKDGGSVQWTALCRVYSVTIYKGYDDDGNQTAGLSWKVFGQEVYSSYHLE